MRDRTCSVCSQCLDAEDQLFEQADEIERLREDLCVVDAWRNKVIAENERLRSEKNDLVLKAYPAMDAVDRVRKLIQGAEYENTVFTVAQIREALQEGE